MAWKNDQVSLKETEYIIDSATSALEIEGDFVELGCYRGDTSLCLAEVVEKYNKNLQNTSDEPVENSGENLARKLWIYDSFEGLPEKNREDESVLGKEFVSGALGVTKREVKERFLKAGLKVPIIKKAWFNELTSDDMPEKIAFAFLDGDFYGSIKDSLNLVTPLMTSGGVILAHDYNNLALPGVKKAVDEWLTGKNVKTEVFETLIKITIKN
ncbi:class I SAM-dependent methyltransferase [Candidatus Saccharibacteria bacterium]|nr:class I SAM-dependent methyltransferase [Candidatus Saccharibacteria bacterium]